MRPQKFTPDGSKDFSKKEIVFINSFLRLDKSSEDKLVDDTISADKAASMTFVFIGAPIIQYPITILDVICLSMEINK